MYKTINLPQKVILFRCNFSVKYQNLLLISSFLLLEGLQDGTSDVNSRFENKHNLKTHNATFSIFFITGNEDKISTTSMSIVRTANHIWSQYWWAQCLSSFLMLDQNMKNIEVIPPYPRVVKTIRYSPSHWDVLVV